MKKFPTKRSIRSDIRLLTKKIRDVNALFKLVSKKEQLIDTLVRLESSLEDRISGIHSRRTV